MTIVQLYSHAMDALISRRDDDPIHACHVNLDLLKSDPDHLLKLAKTKLNVFPFHSVQPCWFRLFTDASIAQAVRLVESLPDEKSQQPVKTQRELDMGIVLPGEQGIDQVVSLLDMALIMAGGVGREDMIHGLLAGLKERDGAQSNDFSPPDEDGQRPRKKRKIQLDGPGPALMPEQQRGCDVPAEESTADIIPLNPSPTPQIQFPVPAQACPSLNDFKKHMDDVKTPLVLTGVMDHWPALQQWRKKSYWTRETLDGRRLVPVEIGRSYTDDDWGQRLMKFGEFLDQYVLTNVAGCGKGSRYGSQLEAMFLERIDLKTNTAPSEILARA